MAESPTDPSQIRIVICDDDPAFRFLVRLWLEPDAALDIVAEDSSIDRLLPRIQELKPAIVVLDGGVASPISSAPVAEIRRASPRTKVLLVSGMPPWTLDEMMNVSGADAGLSKSAGMDDVHRAIHRLAE